MVYISVTNIDAGTGVLCTLAPMQTGPAFPPVKNFTCLWANASAWPVEVLPDGTYATAPIYFGTCDDDADLLVVGVLATHTQEEFAVLRHAEFLARKPVSNPSFVGDEASLTWAPPLPYPDDGKFYGWDEPSVSWVELTPPV